MDLNTIIKEVAKELDQPEDLVRNTYKSYWEFIKDSIESLPLKEDLSSEDFETLRTSINIPSLGKLNCTYSKYLGIKARFNIINKIRNK